MGCTASHDTHRPSIKKNLVKKTQKISQLLPKLQSNHLSRAKSILNGLSPLSKQGTSIYILRQGKLVPVHCY